MRKRKKRSGSEKSFSFELKRYRLNYLADGKSESEYWKRVLKAGDKEKLNGEC
jgi:hypothetical protein